MARPEPQTLREIRAAMARLGRPADDRTDDQLRAAAVSLVGDRPDALAVILRTLSRQ
jgi:hypothetical protein